MVRQEILVGERVTLDLRVRGGEALAGVVLGARIRYWDTDREHIRYWVVLDEPFCEQREWYVLSGRVTRIAKGVAIDEVAYEVAIDPTATRDEIRVALDQLVKLGLIVETRTD